MIGWELQATARAMVAKGKGILAADEPELLVRELLKKRGKPRREAADN
ncbi:MAG: fructose-bisphosphate aldolase class I [Dehalococcoidia bacterium]|nr:fructose-bisphosphate aldolase class I [Dehalococcoidia bacterium]